MKSNTSVRGGIRIWATVSFILFIAIWFVPFVDDYSAASVWMNFAKHQFNSPTSEKLKMLGLAVFLFSVASTTIGWVLQFPVAIAFDYFSRSGKSTSETASTVNAEEIAA